MTDATTADEPLHVAGVCGSLAEQSVTRFALRRALDAVADAGATTDLVDLRHLDVPMFDSDVDVADAGEASELAGRVSRADAVLLGTPMYHGSYSSPMKTALDYCGFDEFESTTVGLLAVAGGGFPVTALEHLRSVCRAVNAWVVPHQAAIPRVHDQFDGDDLDDDLDERVRTLGRRVVEYATIEPDPRTFESTENVGAEE